MCITGINANMIALYMFCRGIVKTPTMYQLQWLAGVDTVYLLFWFISWHIDVALDKVFGISIPLVAYNCIIYPLINVFYIASIWLTVFIALYRYLAICKPFTNAFRHVENHGEEICSADSGFVYFV